MDKYPNSQFVGSVVLVVLMAFIMLFVQHITSSWILKYSILAYFAFYLFLFLLPVVPGALAALANDPIKHPGNPYYGFFIFMQQGRVVINQLGKTFFRAIMDFSSRMWFGERNNSLVPRQPKYWDVEGSGEIREMVGGEEKIVFYPDSHPVPFPVKSWEDAKARWWWFLYCPFSINWWVWKRYTYGFFGAVFTGFYWWQAPLIHQMRYKKIQVDESGTINITLMDSKSNHFRVEQFTFGVIVPKADTKDQSQAQIIVIFVLRVFNPFMAAYRTDGDLGGRIETAATAAITEFTRSRDLVDVQAAQDGAKAREMATILKEIGDRSKDPPAPLCSFGVECIDVQIQDISPSTPGLAESLAAFAVAQNKRKADEELAKGQAAYIARAREAAAGDPNSVALARARADVEMVQAGAKGQPGNLIIINSGRGGDDVNPVHLATFQALTRQTAGANANAGTNRRSGGGGNNPPTITPDGTADTQ